MLAGGWSEIALQHIKNVRVKAIKTDNCVGTLTDGKIYTRLNLKLAFPQGAWTKLGKGESGKNTVRSMGKKLHMYGCRIVGVGLWSMAQHTAQGRTRLV